MQLLVLRNTEKSSSQIRRFVAIMGSPIRGDKAVDKQLNELSLKSFVSTWVRSSVPGSIVSW